MDSIRSQLLDMGFNEMKIKRAIESCPEAQTLEQVMEWLIAHEDELNSTTAQQPSTNPKLEVSGQTAATQALKAPTTDTNDGPADETVAQMSARKKITAEEAQRIIAERQAKRVEEERKKEIEDEKKRRLAGQKMAETRAELQDQERIRLAQQIRKEKLEKEQYKKQLLEQIARDREAMRAKNQANVSGATAVTNSEPSSSSSPSKSNPPRPTSTECKIALRFSDGSSLVHKFSPNEQLAAVRLFVIMEKKISSSSEIEFIAPPNKKLTEENMTETLEKLGLCPASRLEVKYKQVVWSDMD